MNDLDTTLIYPPALLPVLPPIDAEAAGLPDLPADHPQWQRDVVSISSRARAVIANVVPVIVRTRIGGDISIYWRESNVPLSGEITRTGFGTRLLTEILPRQLDAIIELSFKPDGLSARLVIPG